MSTTELPKVVWMFWHSGLEQAPEVVRLCYESWQTLNPGWEIRLLDASSVGAYVQLEHLLQSGQMCQALSDILRINLLAKYGGVWADATCYCQAPLETWLPAMMASGFFAFERQPRTGKLSPRYLDTWFLASHERNYLTTTLCDMTNAYWLENPGLARRPKISRFVHRLATTPARTGLYFSYPVVKLLKLYPYMWPAFLFTRLLQRDPRAREIWQQTPRLSVEQPHHLQHVGLLEPLTHDIKLEIDARTVPVYKLTWRYPQDGVRDGCVLDYLFSARVDDTQASA